MAGPQRSLLWVAAVTSLLVALALPTVTAWSWDGKAEDSTDTKAEEPLEVAESMKLLTGEVPIDRVGTEANATAVDEIVDSILTSGREGRNLNGFDDLYKDPTVAEAIQNADDVSARNLIKDKLCDLGLSSCDYEDIEGKRPYLRPQDLIYAQPVAIRPVGRPIASVPYPNGNRGPPPPHRGGNGPYGPPRPMPPPRKVGYEGPPQSFGPPKGPFYNGPPQSSGPGGLYSNNEQGIYYGSKAPGPVFEGPEQPPYSFESHSQNKIHTLQTLEKPAVLETAANSVQQHVHHHYHHGEDTPTKIVQVPVPVATSGLTSTLISNELNSHAFSSSSGGGFPGSSGGFSGSSGGFSGSSGGFNPNDLKTAQSLNGLHTSAINGPVYPVNGPKPIYEGVGNQGPATFGGSGSGSGFSSGSGSLYSNQPGSYHASNPDFYKKELNHNGPLQSSGLSSYSSGQQQSFSGNNYYSNAGYQGQETARQENFDCVCVPYEQCPAHDIIGRKDDGPFLAVDPRNTGTNIEALSDEAVLTDSNGTMTVVRVTKDAKNATVEEEPKKISKRDVSEKQAEAKSDDGKANVEPVSINPLNCLAKYLTLYSDCTHSTHNTSTPHSITNPILHENHHYTNQQLHITNFLVSA